MSDEIDKEALEAEFAEKYGSVNEEMVEVEPEEEESTSEEYNEEEAKARSNGWDPDKGDLSAKEFNMRGEFIGELRKSQSQIKDLHSTITKMTIEQQAREESIRQQTIAEMEAKRREAIEMGDVDTFDAYDEQIKAYESQNATPQAPSVDPAVADFKARNASWFNDDTIENYEMKQYATMASAAIAQKNPNITAAEELKMVELEVRKRFPERFKNSKKVQASPVGGTSRADRGSSGSYADISSLTPVQKSFYQQACNGQVPGMTGKEYLKSLKNLEKTGRT